MSGKDLVYGYGALFDAHLHFAQECEHGITRDSGKNSAGKRRGDGDAVDNEHDVHDAGFFDEATLLAIEPHHIVIAPGLRELRGEQTTTVVASGFGVASAAGECPNVSLFGEEANGLREIGSTGRSKDYETVAAGSVDHQGVAGAEINRANVKG